MADSEFVLPDGRTRQANAISDESVMRAALPTDDEEQARTIWRGTSFSELTDKVVGNMIDCVRPVTPGDTVPATPLQK
jgi:hypothetical protein